MMFSLSLSLALALSLSRSRSLFLSPPPSLSDHIFSMPGACNFNMPADQWEEVCQLTQEKHDDCDWTIAHMSHTLGSGPLGDHSPGVSVWYQCSDWSASSPHSLV